MKRNKLFNVEIFDGEDTYAVQGVYYPGRKATRSNDYEPAEIDVASVIKNGSEFNLKQLRGFAENDTFMDAAFMKAEQQIMEVYYGY